MPAIFMPRPAAPYSSPGPPARARSGRPPVGRRKEERPPGTSTEPGQAAAAERCTRTFAGSRAPPPVLRHGDDDLAACVPLLHAAQAVGRVGQGVGPVEDRCELPRLDEPGE